MKALLKSILTENRTKPLNKRFSIFSFKSDRAFADAPLAYPRYVYRLLCRKNDVLVLSLSTFNPTTTTARPLHLNGKHRL